MVYDATIPWDMRYFESLNRIVQTEPWLARDKAMIDQLKSIGIEKGKPFNPDAKTQDTLKERRVEAHAWLADKYETSYFPPPYYEGGHWTCRSRTMSSKGMSTFFANPRQVSRRWPRRRLHARLLQRQNIWGRVSST